MAEWRLRPVGSFPSVFAAALAQGPGVDKVVIRLHTEMAARYMQKQFRLFRFCLRSDAMHPLVQVERELIHRTRVAYNWELKLWELLLTSRESVTQDMQIGD